jgi:hypothetical protein
MSIANTRSYAMAAFIRLFGIQYHIKFWCSLIVKRSEARQMLIAQTVMCRSFLKVQLKAMKFSLHDKTV